VESRTSEIGPDPAVFPAIDLAVAGRRTFDAPVSIASRFWSALPSGHSAPESAVRQTARGNTAGARRPVRTDCAPLNVQQARRTHHARLSGEITGCSPIAHPSIIRPVVPDLSNDKSTKRISSTEELWIPRQRGGRRFCRSARHDQLPLPGPTTATTG